MALKLARPFAATVAANPSNPSRQMRVVVVAWLGVAPCDKLSSSSFTRRASARLNGRPMDAHREIGHSRDRLRFSRVFRLCTGVLGGDRAPWHSVIHVADGEHRNQSISMNRERVRFAAARIARLATGRATPTGPACQRAAGWLTSVALYATRSNRPRNIFGSGVNVVEAHSRDLGDLRKQFMANYLFARTVWCRGGSTLSG